MSEEIKRYPLRLPNELHGRLTKLSERLDGKLITAILQAIRIGLFVVERDAVILVPKEDGTEERVRMVL